MSFNLHLTLTTFLQLRDHLIPAASSLYLNAWSPSDPSKGQGGRQDRAWDRKSSGTAHQCREPNRWMSCSNTEPDQTTKTTVWWILLWNCTFQTRDLFIVLLNSLKPRDQNMSTNIKRFSLPLFSSGKLLKKFTINIWSFTPSSGQSLMFCCGALWKQAF